ncbi:YhcN/YlaJ family sporulation lipoprotein [Cerasibacillus terrae]|uniref:YhcN/YlaJ family sporulation lipoprotein n=1 Tax=Cerasibacillus terrae TaxID=2498845 RepID=A0A5C8P328_9BACI|nr:YhcN/YlaJ family sporulation lipoprotein [Cerasibacillus terrae]TXL67563.1 YhcN/YlaJ family sporulation lipoprotein [Cerasibacillus terrae]
MNIRTLVLIIGVTLLSGCMQTNEEKSLQSENDNNRFVQVKQSDQSGKANRSNEQIANHLANIAAQTPNVEDSAAIVAGPYAVVGIDVDQKLNQSRVGTIKYTVSEALRDDTYGKTAVVIADGDINQRIRNMGDKISQGYPVQGVIEELAAIIGRYMPDLPTPQQQPIEPDQNKQKMPKDEREKLNDTQDEQSNHQKNNK